MEGVGHQLFARTRLSVDQNAAVCRGHDSDLFAQRAHGYRLAHHRILFRELCRHLSVNEFESLLSQCVANSQKSLFDRQWFFDKVESAKLGCSYCSFHVAVTGDDDNC